MGSTREIGWDDDSIRGGGFNDEDRYKCFAGVVDLIRVLTNPFAFMIHYTQESGYRKCSRVNRGDDTECPNCEDLGEDSLSEKYGCLIMHLHQRDLKKRIKRGDPEFTEDNVIGVVKAWTFGGDKFADLHDVHMATEGRLRKVDLRVTLQRKKNAEKFQSLSIKEKSGDSTMSRNPEMWEEAKQHFRDNKDRLSKLYFTVKTADEIREQQDEDDEFNPEKYEEEASEEKKTATAEKPKGKPKKALTGAAKKAAEAKAKKDKAAALKKKKADAAAKKKAEEEASDSAEEESDGDDPVLEDHTEEEDTVKDDDETSDDDAGGDEPSVEEELSDFDKELGLDDD